MIRPFTCLCALLAGASGLYLYTEKHRTTLLDQHISQIVHLTDQSRERTSMLKAEWALLSQPDRLQKLSDQFLPSLHPLQPGQFVQLANVLTRLPAKEEPKPVQDPDNVAPAATDAPPAAAPGPDAGTTAVLASALPEKIVPEKIGPADASDGDAPEGAPGHALTVLASAERPAAPIALPTPPFRLATGRPHTQPVAVHMASVTENARERVIDPTADDDQTPAAAPAAPSVAPDLAPAADLPAATLAEADAPRATKPRIQVAQKPVAKPATKFAARIAPPHPDITHQPQLADAIHHTVDRAPTVTQAAYRSHSEAPTVRTVAWHPSAAPSAARATPHVSAPTPSYGSALGGSGAALPPPIPLGG